MKECDTLLIGKNEVITERVVGILKGGEKSGLKFILEKKKLF